MNMKRWFAGIAVTVALMFGASTGALAIVSTVPESPLDAGEFSSFSNQINGSGVAFTDYWEFVYNSGSLILTLENDNGFSDPNPPFDVDITGLQLALYEDSNAAAGAVTLGSQLGATLGPVASGVIDGLENPDLTALFAATLFTPGSNYVFVISGTTSVGQNVVRGRYNVELSSVPLPPAIWLFISALVGLVSFARIRRNGTPA